MATMLYTLGPLKPLRELYPEPRLMDLTKHQPQPASAQAAASP